jgi:hypothetical protein
MISKAYRNFLGNPKLQIHPQKLKLGSTPFLFPSIDYFISKACTFQVSQPLYTAYGRNSNLTLIFLCFPPSNSFFKTLSSVPLSLIEARIGQHSQFSFDPRNSPTSPIMIATTPPTSIHIALSVGEPVKNREMSELNDFDAATPKIVRRIPPARIASETALFMEKSSF